MPGSADRRSSGKKVSREPQKVPLVVSAARTRVSEEVVMSSAAARELRAYVGWAATKTGMTEAEIMVLTLDRAIFDLLRRDELWHAEKAENQEGESAQVTGAANDRRTPVEPVRAVLPTPSGRQP